MIEIYNIAVFLWKIFAPPKFHLVSISVVQSENENFFEVTAIGNSIIDVQPMVLFGQAKQLGHHSVRLSTV